MNLAELTDQMEENNRSNYEIERHTRNSRAHLLEIKKTVASGAVIQSTMAYSVNSLVSLLTGNALAQLEKDREMMRLLKGLGKGDSDSGAGPEQFQGSGSGQSLGALLTAAAAGIGLAIGAFKGWLDAIKALKADLGLAKFFTNLKISVQTAVANLRVNLLGRISAIGVAMGTLFDSIKAKFNAPNPDSPLGKALGRIGGIFTRLGLYVGSISKPFVTIIDVIKTMTAGPVKTAKATFQTVMTHLKSFGSAVTKISSIVGKVFAPLIIITTMFDTIKGAIDGYAEGGIIGGLEGAISGFFNSIITVPLDMVKNAAAWLLEKVGLITPETSADIKAFSFTDLFNDMLGGVFDLVKGSVEWVKTLFTDPGKALSDLWNGLYGEEGIYNKFIWEPINSAVNWIMEKFGFKDEGAPDFDLFTYISDTWNGVVDRVKAGFQSFGDWIASIPDRLKLFAYEKINSIPGGGFIVSDEDVVAARAAVTAGTTAPSSGATIAATETDIADTRAMNGHPMAGGISVQNSTGDTNNLTLHQNPPSAISAETGVNEDLRGYASNWQQWQ